MATWVSFGELKARVSMKDILSHYGMLGKLRRQGDEMVGLCPFHDDKQPSFSVNISKDVFQCFAGSCQKKGDILDFVANMESVDVRQASLMIKVWFKITSEPSPSYLGGASPTHQTRVNTRGVGEIAAEGNTPLTVELKNLDAKHPYLQERGLTEETTETFGIVSRAERNCTGRAEQNYATERRGVRVKVLWYVRA